MKRGSRACASSTGSALARPASRCSRSAGWSGAGLESGGVRGAAERDRVEQLLARERLAQAAGGATVHRGAEEISVDEARAARIAGHGDDRHVRRAGVEDLDGVE